MRGNQEFCFGHVKFELSGKHSDGAVKEAVVGGSLKNSLDSRYYQGPRHAAVGKDIIV